jgi:hypothetical protein
MQRRRALSLSVLVLLAAGCAGINVKQDYNPEVDFDALRTFAWRSPAQEPTGNKLVDSPLLDARVRAAVERELLAKGHRKAAAKPDYHLAYSYSIESGVKRDPDTSVGVGVGSGSRGSFGGIGVSLGFGGRDPGQERLMIDVIDPGTNNLLWRGFTTRRLESSSDPQENIARINETVGAILREFPPRKRK